MAGATVVPDAPPKWAGPLSGEEALPECAETKRGLLSNAMTYYTRENREPRERVELSVVVRAGSIDELEDERGLAHAIEHLAFRARKGETGSWGVMRELEAAGVKFGSHQNAYTSQEETVYFLHVPSDFVGRALTLLADLVCDVRLDEKDVDAERQIILEEWRQGKHWTARASEAHMKTTFAGTRIPDRLPIGTLEVITHAPASTLRRFYERQYKPGAMAVIVAGDLKAIPGDQGVVEMLESAFGKYYSSAAAAPEWPRPPEVFFPPTEKVSELCRHFLEAPVTSNNKIDVRVSVVEDAEATGTSTSVTCARAVYPKVCSVGEMRDSIAEELFHVLLNRRLHRRAIDPNPPFANASCGSERPMALTRGHRALGLTTLAATPRTRSAAAGALAAAWSELERARRDNAFSEAEVKVGKREILSDLQSRWLERDQVDSSSLSDDAKDHFLYSSPILSVEVECSLGLALLDDIQPAELKMAADRIYPTLENNNESLVVCCTRPSSRKQGWWPFGKEEDKDLAGSLEKALRSAMIPDDHADVKRPDDAPSADEIFKPTSGPGEVVRRSSHALGDGELTATELEFSNGLRVVFLRTDFKDDEVVAYGVAPGGLTQLGMRGTVEKKALVAAKLASSLGREYGYYGVPRAAVMDALGGRRVSLGAEVEAYRRVFEGECAAEELETLLAMVHRLFAKQPTRDKQRLSTYLETMREVLREHWRDPRTRHARLIDEVNTQKNAFFESLKPEDLDEANFDADMASDYFQSAFGDPNGFSLVLSGNLPEDDTELEALACKYLASIIPAASTIPGDFGFSVKEGASSRSLKLSEIASLGVEFPSGLTERSLRFEPVAGGENSDADSLLEGATRLSLPVELGGTKGRSGGHQELAEERLRDHLFMDLGCTILSTRLTEQIRFQESAAYSISCGLTFAAAAPLTSAEEPLQAVLGVYASHDPKAATKFAETCITELQKFADEGPLASEIDSALKAAKNDRAEQLRKNTFWAPSLALTYVNARYAGDLGHTFRQSERLRDQVHTNLLAGLATTTVVTTEATDLGRASLLRDAFRRGLEPSDNGKRRTVLTLLPRAKSRNKLLLPLVGACVAVAAIATITAARTTRRA